MESVLQLMELALAVPDPATLSRRARTWQSANRQHDRQVPPEGPVLFLSTASACRSTARTSSWRIGTAPDPVAVGASCIWHWMPTAARSLPYPD